MILAELLIENYKHYAGEHRIELPPHGVIGVIGANGVGKTTLFDAIEWCLYNPREIENADVPPRGGIGRTRVCVVLEDARDGLRYVVERTLKSGRADAEIYREDRPETRITQGSKQVSDYVARHLIGLSHRAFVSTFFTRQKELSFFGNLKETDRRREVGRLLGLETIREAQRLIGEDRAKARAEATSLANQHEELSTGRDFAAETAAVDESIHGQEAAAAAAAARLAAATDAHTRVRAELDHCRDLEREDARLAQELERVSGDERAVTARLNAAGSALHRLDELAQVRDTLSPLAAREAEHAAAVESIVADQERAGEQRRLQTELDGSEQQTRKIAQAMERAVVGVGLRAATVPGWAWWTEDAADPIAAADRRIALVAALDVDDACETAVKLARCRTLADERDQAVTMYSRYRERLQQIETERAAVLAGGDPDAAAADARRAREAALREADAALAAAEQAVSERRRLESLTAALRAERFEDRCPTCARPFSPDEADAVVTALDERVAALRAAEARQRQQGKHLQRQAIAHERAETEATAQVRRPVDLNGRIDQAAPMVREVEHTSELATARCAQAIADAGLDGEPTPERVKEAQTRADLFQAIAKTVPLLQQLKEDAGRAVAATASVRHALAALGPVTYDRAAHAAAEAALAEARDAAARVAQIDEELARRPAYEGARDRGG